MLKVLIADDEIKILQLISHLVRWEDYDMEVIATATDGNQAFMLLSEYEPDVVITDIRMPNISGVELVEKAVDMELSTYFVIVSGYSDFAYAQKAIKLGVEDYLLKPIKRKELDAVLRRIREKSGAAKVQIQEKEKLVNELTVMRGKLKDNVLSDLISNNSFRPEDTTKETLYEEYGIRFTGKSFRSLILHLYPEVLESPETTKEELDYVLPKLLKEVKQRLQNYCHECLTIIQNQEILCLINYDAEQIANIEEQISRLRVNITYYNSIYPDMNVIAALGELVNCFEDAEKSYKSAQEVLKRRFDKKGVFLLTSGKVPASALTPGKLITPSEQALIKKQIETMDKKGLDESLSDLGKKFSEQLDQGTLLYACYEKLADLFLVAISESITADERKALRARFMSFPELLSDFNAAFSSFKKVCLDTLAQVNNEKLGSEHLPVRQAKDYISTHFNMAITLESVSREIGFNPAYFSTLFKKETGQNFSEYLTNVRMENAKHMLKQSNKDISEISMACGYQDIKYFSRLFKKSVHITPSEYRKLYG